ncbi:hypothetical protein Taro_001662 [Colocasia esculenta]|uniref:Uncharacterized protein n=1 Tax=Colocasia esculenta TaxID=4460 RepID=A0A843TH01_COLES|nr:hypothetical protein [Colocasia esculenta]
MAALSRSSGEFSIFGVLATQAGEGLVIPTGPCSRGSLPLLPSARGSSPRELGVRRDAEMAVALCVVSSSESKCCELLYLIRGGTDVCGFPTSRCVQGPGCFYLSALDLVEVSGGRACGETSFSPGCCVASTGHVV